MKHHTRRDIFIRCLVMFVIMVLASVPAYMSIVLFTGGGVPPVVLIVGCAVSFVIYLAAAFLFKGLADLIGFYVSILDSVKTPVVAADLNNKIVFANLETEKVCEVNRDKLIGTNFDKAWDNGITNPGANALKNGRSWLLCNYRDKHYQLEMSYRHDAKNTEKGYVQVLQDISRMESLFGSLNTSSFMITDAKTDEVVFISDAMRKLKNLGNDDFMGKACWNMLHGLDERCHDCDKEKLMNAPKSTIETEVFDALTGRYYMVVNALTKWAGGQTMHTCRLIDITERKQSEEFMKKRLEQQELMTTISLAFFSNSNIQDSINTSLSLTGKFLDASRIVLARYDKKHYVIRMESEWNNKNYKSGEFLQTLSYTPIDGLYMEFVNHRKKFAIGDSSLEGEAYADIFKSGVKTFMAVPLYVFDTFWGIVSIEYAAAHKWDRSDISLALFLGNILSGFLYKGRTEADLMRMSSIANNSPQFISYIDLRGKFLFINTGATDVTGYDYHEIQDGGLRLLHGEETEKKIVDEYLPECLDKGKLTFEAPVYIKDGGTRILSVSAFFIPDIESGIGMIATDITEQRNLESDIMAAKEAAEAANDAKSEFLYRMSYEIRTPATAIAGMTNIAKMTKNFAQVSYCLEQVENASGYLLSVINDVLDVSKIEANKLELAYDDLDIGQLIRQVTGMFSFLIDKNGLNLTIAIADDVPAIIISDKLRISQILTNLLSNAVRFSPENGNITLVVSAVSMTKDECVLKIDVTDYGIGDAASADEPLFNSLDEAEGHILQKYAGSRVGLSLAKRIVELMGGEITYASDPNLGSVVSFSLRAKIGSSFNIKPMRDDDDYMGALPIEGRYRGKCALLADDIDLNSDIFAALLSNTQLELDYAQNGIEACAMFRENPKKYDIILMDIHMPEMNGFEAAKTIRKMDHPYAAVVPIVALTADVFKENIDKCLEAGMNSHVAKPMDFPNIIRSLDKYLLSPPKGDINSLDEFKRILPTSEN